MQQVIVSPPIAQYTPEQSKALENHYIIQAKELSRRSAPKLPVVDSEEVSRAKREAVLKSERSKAAAKRREYLLSQMPKDFTLRDVMEKTGSEKLMAKDDLRHLHASGDIVLVQPGRGSKPSVYRRSGAHD